MNRSLRLRRWFVSWVAVLAALAACTSELAGTANAGAAGSVRGFDGTTVTVAGLGIESQFGNDPIGAQARIKRFNDDNEIKGVKIDYAEFVDDKQDQATTLSEARRLVTQVGVFALVGDVSQFNPGDYFAQQQVPYFGFAFDDSYCSKKPSKKLWGFGFNGCLVPSDPSWLANTAANPYTYVSEKTGKKQPTVAMFSNDTQSGKNSVKFGTKVYNAAGFKVVAGNSQMPVPPVADYTPYAQAMLTADNGKPPDLIVCNLVTDCIPMWNLIKAQGFEGTYIANLYSDLLVKALDGAVSSTLFTPLDQDNPGMNQMKEDLDAFQSGAAAKADTGMVAGYLSTDMFIQALKKVAAKGKSNITPANVRKVASTMTWRLKGVAGPTQYPDATVGTYQTCSALVFSDGTAWNQVLAFTCGKQKIKP
jgi:ABC-type branched-subunit amino acid transport system substrate-binding protein